MRTIKIEHNENAEKIADTLLSLGQSRCIALTLAFMHGTKEATEADLESGANLRQPEVSIAMRQLKERGWIEEKDVKNIGKGRPHKVYSLRIGFGDIIAQLEQQQRIVESEAQARIKRLRELLK